MEYCKNSSMVNPGCRWCSNAPLGATYTSGCAWVCGLGYQLFQGACEWNAVDRDQLAIVWETFVWGERFDADVYCLAFSELVLAPVFVGSVETVDVDWSTIEALIPVQGSRRRQLLAQPATVVEKKVRRVYTYFWMPPGSASDPVKPVLEGVITGSVQSSISESMDLQIVVSFAYLPKYMRRQEALDEIVSRGAVPQGLGVVDRYPPEVEPEVEPEEWNVDCSVASVIGYVFTTVALLVTVVMFGN